MNNKGTPKTLKQAIFNAFEAQQTKLSAALMAQLENDIKDYAAQKFGLYMLKHELSSAVLQYLFRELFSEEIRK